MVDRANIAGGMAGRASEREAGRRFLEAVASGRAGLVLEGEPGIGKTTMWREIVASAEARGYRVLACRAAPTEARLSFAGLADLLADVEGSVLERLPTPQRQAIDVALLRASPGVLTPEPRALGAGLSTACRALTETAPLILAIDDLQWLDGPSRSAVEFAFRRADGLPLGLLVTVRAGEGLGRVGGVARLIDEGDVARVVVGPLSVAALHEVIATCLGHTFSRPILVRIAAAARGNPFHALEIARELIRRGGPPAGERLPVPDDLSDLVAARIRRLPAATRTALLTAAAQSKTVVEVTDGAALEPAEVAGLVQVAGDRVSFAHPLFASAVYAMATAARRREVHQHLSLVVADVEERARHMALGAASPDEAIAAALELAAGQARRRGAPDAAAELMELAVRLTPVADRDRFASRALAAAEHHFHAGDLARARALAEPVLLEVPAGVMHGHALRVLGEIRYHDDSFAEAVPLFEQALGEIGDDPRRVDLHVNLAYAHVNLGDLPAAAPHARAAVEASGQADDQGRHAIALATSTIIDFYLGEVLDRSRLETALALEDPDRQVVMPMRPSLIAGIVWHESDEFERAARVFSDLRRRTIERGEESDLPLLDAHLSLVERRQGRPVAALVFADEGVEIARTVSSAAGGILVLAERCYVRATLGDVAGARADAAEALRLASMSFAGFAGLWIRWALAFLEWSLGDAGATAAQLEPVARIVEARGACDPIMATFLPDEIEALVALGNPERAERLAALLERYGRAHARPSSIAAAARAHALILAARGDLVTAQVAAHAAVEADHPAMLLERGRSQLVLGQIARRARQKQVARRALQQAQEMFEDIPAPLWAEKARAEMTRTGARHAQPGELTPTEDLVARLAADGLTNRRIGEAAFLSPKTVEANLARVYGKLGIRSRAELGRAMADRGRPLEM